MQALQHNGQKCYEADSQPCNQYGTTSLPFLETSVVEQELTVQGAPSSTSLRSYRSFREVSSPRRLPALTATKLLGRQPSKVPAFPQYWYVAPCYTQCCLSLQVNALPELTCDISCQIA